MSTVDSIEAVRIDNSGVGNIVEDIGGISGGSIGGSIDGDINAIAGITVRFDPLPY